MSTMGPERRAENAFREHVQRQGGLCVKLGGSSGIPDREVIGPHGVHYYAEFKSASGRLTKRQIAWREKLKSLGHVCKLHRSAAEAIDFYEQTVEAQGLSEEGS